MHTPKQSDSSKATPQVQKRSSPSGAPTGASNDGLKVQLRSVGYDEGQALLSPDVQMKGGGGANDVHRAAQAGISGGGGALPHRDAIQASFGHHDVGGVQGHVGGKASAAAEAMGASAYATGDHVAFGGSPDLHTAAHEAAHVVQQRAGVSLAGGVGETGDRYEQHADQVANAVVQGKSAEPLLDQIGGGPSVQKKAVQREAAPEAGKLPSDKAAAEPSDWRDDIIKDRDSLVNGAKVNVTEVEGQGKKTSFADAKLEQARAHFAAQLGAPDTDGGPAAATPKPEEQPKADGPAGKAPAAPKAKGDSEAKDVGSAPKWFNVFQNHCIESGEWTKDQKVIQILVSAYLYATMGTAPANVLAFFDHAGKSEKNSQAGDLSYGAEAKEGPGQTKQQKMDDKSTKNWCQQASTDALAQGFNNCGYIFVTRTVSAAVAASMGMGAQRTITDKQQGALAALLAKDIPKLVPPSPDDKAGKTTGSYWGVKKCWDAKLEPGDLASYVTSKSAVSDTPGHAITIISAQDGGDARPFKYISGNAGSVTSGNGSIRFEEGVWIPPPPGFELKTTRPKNSGEAYIYSITKTSKLQPNLLDDIRAKDPAKLAAFHVVYDPTKDKRQAAKG